jgi:hypothetical protein
MRFQYAFTHEITGFEGAHDSTNPARNDPTICPQMRVGSCPTRYQRDVPGQL